MEDGRSFKRKEGKKEQKTAWGSRRSRGGVLLVRRRGSSLSFPPLLHPSKKKKGGGGGEIENTRACAWEKSERITLQVSVHM
jgi:hypothetical protein